MTKFIAGIKRQLLLKLLSEYRTNEAVNYLLKDDLNNPLLNKLFDQWGYFFLKKHYYLPIPGKSEREFLEHYNNTLTGLTFDDPEYFKLIIKLTSYFNEFRGLSPKFELLNGTFMAIDAHIYYAFIRFFKPKTIIEIGTGNSTKLALLACKQNKLRDNHYTRLISIDPYVHFSSKKTKGFKFIKKEVQKVPLRLFKSLRAGDILFLDSTHVLKPGGDVQYEYLEIIPHLKPGVFIHIHDVSLPKNYPEVYFNYHWYWNEQYLLQAFLAYNYRYNIVWPGNYLMTKFPKKMKEIFPEFRLMRKKYPCSEPSSFWIQAK